MSYMIKRLITSETSPLTSSEPCVLALGNFDGVHLGHQKLLAVGRQEAERRNLPLAVLRFFPHPDKVIFPQRELKLLSTPEKQEQLFAQAGVNLLYEQEFTKETAKTEPEEFVAHTLRRLNAVHVVVGFNYSFGYKGKGDPAMLTELGRDFGMEVSVVEAQVIDGQVVSSTRIRQALSEGNVRLAAAMLGRQPEIVGKVVRGEQRGRTIGFPTANVQPAEGLLVPRRGVYAVQALVKGQKYGGMMNIGAKPTFHAAYMDVIEVHLFDFNANIYGETIEILLIERIRDEQKFASAELLQAQLRRDAQQAMGLAKL